MRNYCIDVKYGIDVETPQDLRASGMIKDKKKAFGYMLFQTHMTIWSQRIIFIFVQKYIYTWQKICINIWLNISCFKNERRFVFFLSVLRLHLFDQK